MALLPNAVLGIGAPRNRQPEPERTPGAVLGLPTVASPSPAPAPGPAPAPVVAQPQAVAPVQDGNWLMNWLTSMAQNPGQPLTVHRPRLLKHLSPYLSCSPRLLQRQWLHQCSRTPTGFSPGTAGVWYRALHEMLRKHPCLRKQRQ